MCMKPFARTGKHHQQYLLVKDLRPCIHLFDPEYPLRAVTGQAVEPRAEQLI